MSTANPRRPAFRPAVERLETVCLLSTVLKPAAVVHARAVIDLKPTTVGADALQALKDSTPTTGRQRLVVNRLTAEDATNQVAGKATGNYRVSILGSITATIVFKTDIDNPRAKDVKVSVDRFGSFLTSGAKLKVQRAVVNFLRRDHDKIEALLNPPQS